MAPLWAPPLLIGFGLVMWIGWCWYSRAVMGTGADRSRAEAVDPALPR